MQAPSLSLERSPEILVAVKYQGNEIDHVQTGPYKTIFRQRGKLTFRELSRVDEFWIVNCPKRHYSHKHILLEAIATMLIYTTEMPFTDGKKNVVGSLYKSVFVHADS